jgi:MFS family permease
VGISNFILLPTMGALSDRIGRRRQLMACAIIALFTGYPALAWLAAEPSLPRLLAVELWLSLVYAGYNGAMVVYLTEIMPASVRTTGFSLAYSLATAVFGGFTPAICTYLIHVTGNRAMPGVWLSVAAFIGLGAVIALGSWSPDAADAIGERSEPIPSERLPEAASVVASSPQI